jgi:hypothetical protein
VPSLTNSASRAPAKAARSARRAPSSTRSWTLAPVGVTPRYARHARARAGDPDAR